MEVEYGPTYVGLPETPASSRRSVPCRKTEVMRAAVFSTPPWCPAVLRAFDRAGVPAGGQPSGDRVEVLLQSLGEG